MNEYFNIKMYIKCLYYEVVDCWSHSLYHVPSKRITVLLLYVDFLKTLLFNVL